MKYTYKNRQPVSSVLEPGIYTLTIQEARLTTSRAGNEMLEIKMRGPDNNFVWDYLTFTERAMWKIDSFLSCFQMQPGMNETIDFDQEFADSLIGESGDVQISVVEYEGKKKNDVDMYLSPQSKSSVEKLLKKIEENEDATRTTMIRSNKRNMIAR